MSDAANTQIDEGALREQIAAEIRAKLEPLLDKDKYQGGYDCCGCSTYGMIVDDAVRVVMGEEPKGYE